jgi:hypothetical protein
MRKFPEVRGINMRARVTIHAGDKSITACFFGMGCLKHWATWPAGGHAPSMATGTSQL